jgi:iron complex transport system substrate-binding protein
MIKRISLLFLFFFVITPSVWGSPHTFPEVSLQYAHGFRVECGNGYYVVTVDRPCSDAADSQSYLLLSKGGSVPEAHKDLPVIYIPVKRIITTSMTMLPFIERLTDKSSLVGVGGKRYVYSEDIRNLNLLDVASDAGSGLRIDVEKILSLQPDVVFVYTYTATEKEAAERLAALGVPIVIASDYLEETPLGMAEWIKFVALFLGEEKKAEIFFRGVSERYNCLKELANKAEARPTVMVNAAIGGMWYVSGGRSWPALLIRDAGGEYLWSEVDLPGSIPIDFEKVLERALNSDFWINPTTWRNLDEGRGQDSRYTAFRPFREKKVYNNNARINGAGANDYYQQGVMRPDLILADLISIFHPTLLPNHELYFYRLLEEGTGK